MEEKQHKPKCLSSSSPNHPVTISSTTNVLSHGIGSIGQLTVDRFLPINLTKFDNKLGGSQFSPFVLVPVLLLLLLSYFLFLPFFSSSPLSSTDLTGLPMMDPPLQAEDRISPTGESITIHNPFFFF